MVDCNIVLKDINNPLLRFASEELAKYIRMLFKFHPPVVLDEQEAKASELIIIQCASPDAGLNEQEYILITEIREGKKCLKCSGGNARSTLWAVYELVSQWGVNFLIQGDIFPDNPGNFYIPDISIKRKPVFPVREFRLINEMVNSGVLWSVADHQKLFDQLAKLRFSGVFIATYPFHPWVHYSYQGVERDTADLLYGFKHPIHEEMIGRNLFGNYQYHTNLDFQGAETYDKMIDCGKRFMEGIIDAAHKRGLEVNFTMPLNDLPDEFMRKLPELSSNVSLPESTVNIIQAYRLGLHNAGEDWQSEKYRTPLNPIFVDMVEAGIVAHIKAYPNAERYTLWEAEFPPGGAGAEECWQELDRKYGLEKIITLQKLKEKAGQQYFYQEGRALAHVLGAIQALYLLDKLINERKILQHSLNPNARIGVGLFSEHILPLVEYVLPPDRCDIIATIDYLPSRVAERIHCVSFAKTGKMPVEVMCTIEDDNVGFLPQMVTQSLHKIVNGMKEYGVKGYCFRQFDISEHEPSMRYMIDASWDLEASPEKSYRNYAYGIAGEQAVPELLKAFGLLEQLTEASNSLMGLGFMMPGLYSNHWSTGRKANPEWDNYRESLKSIISHMNQAFILSAERGKKLISNMLSYVLFADKFVETVATIRKAREHYDTAKIKLQEKNLVEYNKNITTAAYILKIAVKLSEQALKIWADLVVDPTDLGTLAGLNSYGHDWLKGKAVEVYWESQKYGFTYNEE